MILENIERGTRVFIDSNIFIYHFTGASDACSNFLSRCEQGDISGITSHHVYLEVLHRLMMIEAVRKEIIRPPNIAKKLKDRPEKIRLLDEYFMNAQKIPAMGITVRPVPFETIVKSQAIRASYGLMVNDSLIIAGMHAEGIKTLATNDEQFSRVDGLFIYKPHDVKISDSSA